MQLMYNRAQEAKYAEGGRRDDNPFFFSFSDFDCYTSKSKERANGVERIILSCT